MVIPAPSQRPEDVPATLPPEAMPDVQPVQDAWLAELAALLAIFAPLLAEWSADLVERVRHLVIAGDIIGLSTITLDSTRAAAELEASMIRLGVDAAEQVTREAEAQEVTGVLAVGPDRLRMAQLAQVTAAALARSRTSSAVGEALRVWRTAATGDEVAGMVAAHLDDLTDAQPELMLGGALGQAQHDGRCRTIAGGPEAALYADEILDKNTCGPCREVDGRWIGNASDAMVLLTYPTGGYVDCLGRWRCRGQVVAVWRGGSDWRKWIEKPPKRTAP